MVRCLPSAVSCRVCAPVFCSSLRTRAQLA
jgi:hypothetical protein